MDRGDVYWLEMGPTKGHEQTGRRPVVILTPKCFNDLGQQPIVVPVTSGGSFARMTGFYVTLPKECTTTGIVRCDQVATLDFSARGHQYKETLPQEVIDEILKKVKSLFE